RRGHLPGQQAQLYLPHHQELHRASRYEPSAAHGKGKSPNSSRMRRRSRSRGSVAPPTQRLTVLTDTPSWRAATSMVMPSRRRAPAIQSANEVLASSPGPVLAAAPDDPAAPATLVGPLAPVGPSPGPGLLPGPG